MTHDTWFLTFPSFRGYWLFMGTVSPALPKASLACSLGLFRRAGVNQLGGAGSGWELSH